MASAYSHVDRTHQAGMPPGFPSTETSNSAGPALVSCLPTHRNYHMIVIIAQRHTITHYSGKDNFMEISAMDYMRSHLSLSYPCY